MNRSSGRAALLIAVVLPLTACGADSTVPSDVASPSTTTTTASPTTTEGVSLVSGQWVLLTLDGVFTDSGTRVWTTDTIPGSSSLARDQAGGLVWTDAKGLWWLPRDSAQPTLALAGPDIDGIHGVTTTDHGTLVRIRVAGTYRVVSIASGDEVPDPGGWPLDLETGAWTVGSFSIRIVPPEVVLDQEGQPTEILEPAHLVIVDGGVEVMNLRVGGALQAWAQIHDFDGRRIVFSRYVHEPALPTETFFVIDLGCPDCLKMFDVAAARVVLAAERGTPVDLAYVGEVLAPTWDPFAPTPLLSDSGIRLLDDGRYVVLIDTLGPQGSALAVDLMVWFSGEEANIAARIDGEYEPPNNYYIRNEDPTVLWLPIDPDVVITSAWWRYDEELDLSQKPMTLEELIGVFTGTPEGVHMHLIHNPWWITVHGGVVVALDEQYVP